MMTQMKYLFQASTLLLFVVPMFIMTVLYVAIALALRRRSAVPRRGYVDQTTATSTSAAESELQRRQQGNSMTTADRHRRLSAAISQSPNTRRTVIRILGERCSSLKAQTPLFRFDRDLLYNTLCMNFAINQKSIANQQAVRQVFRKKTKKQTKAIIIWQYFSACCTTCCATNVQQIKVVEFGFN